MAEGHLTRRRPRVLAFALVAALCAACSAGDSTRDPAGADTVGETVTSTPDDSSAQPLDVVVADFAAPVDGAAAGNLIRLAAWSGDRRAEACGGSSFVRAEDRYDQARFPDRARIAAEGIGLLQAFNNPIADEPVPVEPSDGGPDPTCLASSLPELTDVEAVQGQWLDTIVWPLWLSADMVTAQEEAAGCLRERLGWSSEDLPNVEAFFAALDGQATRWAQLPEERRRDELTQLDAAATSAFLECSEELYATFAESLRSRRAEFLDLHADALHALSAALDAGGYLP